MAVTVICARCNKRFDVPESYRGRDGACTACGAPLKVPLQPSTLGASAEQLAAFNAQGGLQPPATPQPQVVPRPQAPPQAGVQLNTPASQQKQVTIGRQLGNYELQGKLGGNTSTVFLATGPEGKVALKLLPAQIMAKSPTAGKRFLREARTLFGLNHPNVIRSLNAGEELGTYYLVMELVEGHDLARLLKERGRLSEAEVLKIGVGVVSGLEALNELNLLHRNLKPEHVLLDGQDQVKLVGLGLIRAADAESSGPALTVKGAIVGTPAYMPPEQARAEDLDIRADLYTVGILLYELLTGELPFQAKAVAQILRALSVTPCPDVREKAPEVSAGLWAVIKKLTEKKPATRYQTPANLLTDLEALIAGDDPPIASMAEGMSAGSSKSTKKRKKVGGGESGDGVDQVKRLNQLVIGLGVVVLVLIVVVVAMAMR